MLYERIPVQDCSKLGMGPFLASEQGQVQREMRTFAVIKRGCQTKI